MKRLLLYTLIIGVVWVVPTEKVDVAKLRPVEVIAIYKSGDEVLMMTDTEDVGTGRTAEEALKNMRSTSPAVIYLDTAEYLLVENTAVGEVEALRSELKAAVRLCGVPGPIDLKKAAQYLPVHGDLPALRNWRTGDLLPVLYEENDRFKISQNNEKGT